MTNSSKGMNLRKLVLQMLGGGLAGGLGMSLLMWWLGPQVSVDVAIGAVALIGTGLVYALTGIFVGLGALFPRIGARLLNVADRDDLEDQRAMLIGSGLSCTVLGLALILMALTGPGGAVPGTVAVGALALALVLLGAITAAQWRLYDELMRSVSLESSAIMAGLLMPALTLWAALAHIGYAAPIDPLLLIALLAGTMLLASMIAAGRRGMLVPQ